MFEPCTEDDSRDASPPEEVRALRAALVEMSLATAPKDGVDQIDELERLKSAICATQARIAHEIDQHRQAQAAARRMLEPRRRWPTPTPVSAWSWASPGGSRRTRAVASCGSPAPCWATCPRRWPRSSAATSTSGAPR